MDNERKKELLSIARKSLESAFDGNMTELKDTDEKYGAFVTLTENGTLRGCIGYLRGVMPIEKQIAETARSAAFSDYRFPKLEKEELGKIRIEISLMSNPEYISSIDDFIPGRDGIIIEKYGRTAVFLPQVADETGWGREEMLTALSRKAGLPGDAWKEGAKFQTFRCEVFREE